jgi:accessory gene regulator B
MINATAASIAQKLGIILKTEDKVEIYAYSLKLVIMLLLNLTLVISAAYLLDIVPTVLVFLSVFLSFRAFGGGVHLSTFPRCFVIGSLIMVGLSYFAAEVDISKIGVTIIFLFTFLITLLGIIKWAPASAKTNPVTDQRIVRMQKRNLSFATLVWTCIVLTLIKYNSLSLALAMIAGAMAAVLLMSPGGFFVMEKIDKFFSILRKGVAGL